MYICILWLLDTNEAVPAAILDTRIFIFIYHDFLGFFGR